jgi:hypothetical protein
MTKDKYNMFATKKRADVPWISLPLDAPRVVPEKKQKPKKVIEVPQYKVSRLEEPQDPRPEAVASAVRPQLTGAYFAPHPPRIRVEPLQGLVVRPVVKKEQPLPPVRRVESRVATSTQEFFSATKPLAAKPRLRIPEKNVLKEVVAAPEPLPGSREAKLRAFIKTHF